MPAMNKLAPFLWFNDNVSHPKAMEAMMRIIKMDLPALEAATHSLTT